MSDRHEAWIYGTKTDIISLMDWFIFIDLFLNLWFQQKPFPFLFLVRECLFQYFNHISPPLLFSLIQFAFLCGPGWEHLSTQVNDTGPNGVCLFWSVPGEQWTIEQSCSSGRGGKKPVWDILKTSEKDFSSVKRCTWEETVPAVPGLFLPFVCGSTASSRLIWGPNSLLETVNLN